VLDGVATHSDAIAGNPGAERARIIGDAYLAAMGLSDPVAVHTIRAANRALDLIEAVERFNRHGRYKLKVRIGIDGS
jgi:class 3 adenylate cyclase